MNTTKEQDWPHVIACDAYMSEEEPWRLDRLHRVAGWLAARGVDECVDRLHDTKGCLTVTVCGDYVSNALRAATIEAWDSHIGDLSFTGENVRFCTRNGRVSVGLGLDDYST